jgi:hypothetical protein
VLHHCRGPIFAQFQKIAAAAAKIFAVVKENCSNSRDITVAAAQF